MLFSYGLNKIFFAKGKARDFKKELNSADSNEIFQKYYLVLKQLGYI